MHKDYYRVAIPRCDEFGTCWEDIELVPASELASVNPDLIRGPATVPTVREQEPQS